MYGHNHLIVGMFYKIYSTRGGMALMPFDMLEMPVDVGDEFRPGHAPAGIDATLAMEDFRERHGYRVNRVKVCEGIILSRRTSYGGLEWDRYNTLKYAQKQQAEAAARERDRLEYEARVRAEEAKNIHIGKYEMSVADAIREHGIAPGWFIRRKGHSVWSEISAIGPTGYISGYRAVRTNGRSDAWNKAPQFHRYIIQSESFHPNLHQLIVRKEPPEYAPVVTAETYNNGYGREYKSTY